MPVPLKAGMKGKKVSSLFEGGKRLTQSYNALEIKRLPRSLRSLAMTKKDCDTVSILVVAELILKSIDIGSIRIELIPQDAV